MNNLSDKESAVFLDLKKYFNNLYMIDFSKINMDTSIENDLGLTGDDAFDFIKHFSETFQVSIQSFRFEKYFRLEGTNFISFFLRNNATQKEDDLKIKHLVKAIIQGELE